jgi:DNA processing protein
MRPVLKKETALREEKLVSDLNETETKIFSVMDYQPIHIDKINEVTGLSISDCLVNLLTLEFKGLIRQTPGKNFIKI